MQNVYSVSASCSVVEFLQIIPEVLCLFVQLVFARLNDALLHFLV